MSSHYQSRTCCALSSAAAAAASCGANVVLGGVGGEVSPDTVVGFSLFIIMLIIGVAAAADLGCNSIA